MNFTGHAVQMACLPVILFAVGSLVGCSSKNQSLDGATSALIRYPFEVRPVQYLAEIERSEAFYKKKVSEDPRGALPLSALAAIYVQKAKLTSDMSLFDQAEGLANQSLRRLTFSNDQAELVLVAVAEARHEFPKAIEAAEAVLKSKPKDDGALASLVTANLGYGKLAAARRFADQVIARRADIGTLTLRALVDESQGNEQDARLHFERALRSEDVGQVFDSAWTRAFLGRLLMNRGQYRLAREYFTEALRILPNCHLALALKADLSRIEGDNAAAERYYVEAFNAMGEPPYLLMHAKLKAKLGDEAGAERLRDQAEKLIRDEMASGPYGHHNELARLLLDRGGAANLAEAIEEAGRDAEIRQNAQSHALLAEAYYKAEKPEQARTAIQAALLTGVEDSRTFDLAASIERALGDLEAAESYARRARETNPLFSSEAS